MYGDYRLKQALAALPFALVIGGGGWLYDRFVKSNTTEEQKTEVVATTEQPSGTAAPVVEEAHTTETKPSVVEEVKNPVYICNGGSSECYHRTADCEGLIYCNSSVTKVSKADAEKKHHRRPCSYCYGWQ